MSIFGLPLILFQVGEISLSDLQFIQDRIDAGEWLESHGAINSIGNKITIIPASGKTLYMFRAKIIITGHVTPANSTENGSTTTKNEVEAEFKVNGIQKDTANTGFSSKTDGGAAAGRATSNAYGQTGDGKFDVLGLSLIGDGIKEVAIENTVDDGNADATMSGWIKTT